MEGLQSEQPRGANGSTRRLTPAGRTVLLDGDRSNNEESSQTILRAIGRRRGLSDRLDYGCRGERARGVLGIAIHGRATARRPR
jgi:hypothetical protein